MANYFGPPLGPSHIPNALSAGSVNRLRRAMLKNNTKHKGFVIYQDIQWVEGEKLWYAWFYVTEDFHSIDELEKIK